MTDKKATGYPYISAGSVGALLGLSTSTNEAQAFRRLVRTTHGLESEFVGNVASEYGAFNQAGALTEYIMETGNDVTPIEVAITSRNFSVKPNGFVGDSGIIEIKCPFGQRDKSPPEFKSIHDQPAEYAKVQINMFVTDTDFCDYFQWSQHGTKLERIECDRDWIVRHLSTLCTLRTKALAANPADHDGEPRKTYDTPEAVMLIAEWDELAEAIDNAKERKADILKRLVDMAGDQNAFVAGRNLTLVSRKGSIAYAKAIAELAPDADLEPYRGKPSKSWQVK